MTEDPQAMRIRVVDFLANRGGGIRFVVEVLKALASSHEGVGLDLVSHGSALKRYRVAMDEAAVPVRILDIAPSGHGSSGIWGIEGTWLLLRRLRLACFHFLVPNSALGDCDVVWFPWGQRHRLEMLDTRHVVCTYHDSIILEGGRGSTSEETADERETAKRWFSSSATIAVGSPTVARSLCGLLGEARGGIEVIPLSGEHSCGYEGSSFDPPYGLRGRPYLICPSDIAAHKNHETLLAGVAGWGRKYPLVLTGPGTTLPFWRRRGAQLRRYSKQVGFQIGTSLIPLGYVPNKAYWALLWNAWCLVMPTLAEGGGSFPVMEALRMGVPVICSRIPVLEEMVEFDGGQVIWFDPEDPMDLSSRLRDLERDYAGYKRRAIEQVPRLRHRSWRDVADQYWVSLSKAASS